MAKKLNFKQPIKIKIKGQGGDGVKYMMLVLAKFLDKMKFKVSLVFNYDSAVRGGNIEADLICSEELIQSPIFKDAEIVVNMTTNQLNYKSGDQSSEVINYQNLITQLFSQKKHNNLPENMIVLGLLIKQLGLKLDLEKIKPVLKEKYKQQNLQAIHLAYQSSNFSKGN